MPWTAGPFSVPLLSERMMIGSLVMIGRLFAWHTLSIRRGNIEDDLGGEVMTDK